MSNEVQILLFAGVALIPLGLALSTIGVKAKAGSWLETLMIVGPACVLTGVILCLFGFVLDSLR